MQIQDPGSGGCGYGCGCGLCLWFTRIATRVQRAETEEQVRLATAKATSDAEAKLCAICQTHNVDTALVPCGHLLCAQCSRSLPTRTCPFDRSRIENTCKLYM